MKRRFHPSQRSSLARARWRPLLLMLLVAASPAAAQTASPPADSTCADRPVYRWLDFWVGAWTVSVGAQHVGDSRIERVLGGCAIIEHWEDRRGGSGKSLFYVDPSGQWQQVWVTSRATVPGGVKHKRLVRRLSSGEVRFLGEIHGPDGVILDRTTLTPQPDGTVRQVIETSKDGGTTWATGFDAVYRPKRAP